MDEEITDSATIRLLMKLFHVNSGKIQWELDHPKGMGMLKAIKWKWLQ